MIKLLKKKIQRLLISRNMMKIYYLFHFLNGGFKTKKLNISFEDKKSRLEIVQNSCQLL